MMCLNILNIGTPNNYHFPFKTEQKVVVLGVPILKHFRVLLCPLEVQKLKIVEFANSIDSDDSVYNEPPHLGGHCLPCIV